MENQILNNSFLLIQAVLKTSEFKEKLNRISSYSAYMKQERPIQYAIADLIDATDHKIWLEYSKADIKCYNDLIELKFFYEFDMVQLKKEISEISSMKQFKTNIENRKYSNYAIHTAIFKDLQKCPNVFLLIILSRNLIPIKENKRVLERIKYYNEEFRKYKEIGYSYCNEDLLSIAPTFIERSKKFLQLPPNNKENFFYHIIETHTLFPSTYHFYLYQLK